MAKVTVLVEGYARQKGDYYEATCSTVLIEDNYKKIIVDPGCNEAALVKALAQKGLGTRDIDYVFLTHFHIDHLLNIRLFQNKDILDSETLYRQDKEYEYGKTLPGTKDITITKTPGHAHEGATLFVKTEKGIVAVAEDLFWWEDGKQKESPAKKELLELKDPFAKNKFDLLKSRKLVLKKADWIIPGHGKMFKVSKE